MTALLSNKSSGTLGEPSGARPSIHHPKGGT
jgi:hypothetical protein